MFFVIFFVSSLALSFLILFVISLVILALVFYGFWFLVL